MSRKHFKAIARILAGDYATATSKERDKVVRITLSLADYFQSVNSNFDRDKFYRAVFGSSSIPRHSEFIDVPSPIGPAHLRGFKCDCEECEYGQ
jgi:hypothetical protein